MKGLAVKRTTFGRIAGAGVVLGVMGLSLSTQAWAGKFYKWVDEQGTTHYSAQPPREKPSQQIDINVNRSSDANADGETSKAAPAQQPAPDQQMSDSERIAEIERRSREAVAKNCEIMRKNLETLSQHARVRSVGEDGEVRMLGEDERQARIKKAQDYISANCQ